MQNKTNLFEFLNEYDEIIIPSVQRDYILGFNVKKLKNLIFSFEKNIDNYFDFGSIICYIKNKKIYIYDGQQRISTLIYLLSYLIIFFDKNEYEISKLKRNIKKLNFQNKKEINIFLNNILLLKKENFNIKNFKLNQIGEINCFSLNNIYNLINIFSKSNIFINKKKELFEFLCYNIKFEIVQVHNLELSEQILLDINQKSVKITQEDLFKSHLYHLLSKKIFSNNFEVAKRIMLKIENNWLNFFDEFILINKYNYNPLTFMLNFIKIILIYLNYDKNIDFYNFNLNLISKKSIIKLENIIDNLLKYKNNFIELNYKNFDNIIVKSDILNIEIYKYEFIQFHYNYWNLDNNDYFLMIKIFFDSIINISDSEFIEIKKDILIYLILLNLNNKNINKNMIELKKILNKMYLYNDKAILYENTFIYNNISIYGIPKYYIYRQKKDYEFKFGNENFQEITNKYNNIIYLLFNFINNFIYNNLEIEISKFNVSKFLKQDINQFESYNFEITDTENLNECYEKISTKFKNNMADIKLYIKNKENNYYKYIKII